MNFLVKGVGSPQFFVLKNLLICESMFTAFALSSFTRFFVHSSHHALLQMVNARLVLMQVSDEPIFLFAHLIFEAVQEFSSSFGL